MVIRRSRSIFDRTRSHDAGHAAAGADQDRDEALAAQAELTEHAVEHEGDTRHIAAGLQERQQQEQHQHLRHKAENRADARHDTIQDQAAQPLCAADLLKAVADEHRNAGNPHAIGGGVGCAVGFLIFGVQVLVYRFLELCLGGVRNVGHFQGLFIFQLVGHACIVGRECDQLFQSGLCAILGVILGFGVQRRGDLVRAIFAHEGVDDLVGVAVGLGGLFILGGTDAEQVPAIAEHAVVGPVGRHGAYAHHGDVVHQEHDDHEDRQTQPAVGDHAVDLIGGGQLARVLLLVAALDDLGDVDVALVGDDAFGVIVQLLFGGLDVGFDMRQHIGGRCFSCSSTFSSRSKILMAYQRCCSSGMSCTTASSMCAMACSTGPEKRVHRHASWWTSRRRSRLLPPP